MDKPALRILLVDDKLSMLKIQQGLLQRFGHQVTAVQSANDALHWLASRPADAVDLVLMDMQMPETDGLQATLNIRAAGIRVPIFALTGNDCDFSRTAAAVAGMNGYLTKPLNETKLVMAWQKIAS